MAGYSVDWKAKGSEVYRFILRFLPLLIMSEPPHNKVENLTCLYAGEYIIQHHTPRGGSQPERTASI